MFSLKHLIYFLMLSKHSCDKLAKNKAYTGVWGAHLLALRNTSAECSGWFSRGSCNGNFIYLRQLYLWRRLIGCEKTFYCIKLSSIHHYKSCQLQVCLSQYSSSRLQVCSNSFFFFFFTFKHCSQMPKWKNAALLWKNLALDCKLPVCKDCTLPIHLISGEFGKLYWSQLQTEILAQMDIIHAVGP